jgi:hypothetical protein
MGIFGLFGGKKKTAATMEKPPCPHAALVPRWDEAKDIGVEAKATRYICDACHKEFTPEEAVEIRQGIKDRLVGQSVAEEA